MTRSKGKTLGLVVRVSRVGKREGERFQSPGDQVRDATLRAAREGYEVQVFDADAQNGGVSGATPYDDRPGMGEARRLIKAGKLAGVVVSAMDRLVREDPSKPGGPTLAEFQGWIREQNAVLLVADNAMAEILDPEDDELEGNEEWGVEAQNLNNRLYRREMRKRWRKARKNAIEKGKYVGPTPAGYDRTEDDANGNGGGRLVPNGHAPAIKAAFEIRAAEGSWSKVAAHLTAAGVPTRKGTAWSLKAAEKLLRNEAYIGVARSGPYRNEEAHKPIVTGALFKSVAARRVIRAVANQQREARLLSGLLVCGGCGHRLGYDSVVRQRGGEARKYGYFRCRNAGACTCRAGISERKAERAVVDILDRALGELPEPASPQDGVGLRQEIEGLQARRAEIAARTDLDLDVIAAQTAALKDQIEALQDQIDGLEAGLVYGGTAHDWATEPTEMRRWVLRAVVGRIVVRDGELEIAA